ncbi:MAG: hypothetical protein RJB66_2290 [Pseudomonadota bacterium]|jgi:outer membrane protein assembly factor BamE
MTKTITVFSGRYLAGLFAWLLLVGCQTAPIEDFNKVSLGYDKSDVLEIVGGPSWKDRRNGMDRWTYIIYQDGVRLERQIQFLDGIVNYTGEPIRPFISAEEQDALNAQKNLVLDRMEAAASPPNRPKPPKRDSSGTR